jgi:ATPase family associated with various cellular activities (AAA)
MPVHITHAITLVKPSLRHLSDKSLANQMASLVASVNTKSLKVKGWTLGPTDDKDFHERTMDDSTYQTDMFLWLTYERKDDRQPDKYDAATIVRTLHQRATQPVFGQWAISHLDGAEYEPPTSADGPLTTTKDMIGYADCEIPESWFGAFDHLYGLDSHIARILSALQAGIMSNWTNRYHCALQGPPGCGKSDICRTIKSILGEDAVMEFDATATTAAGAIQELSEREILPRVLIVEEIEKADPKSLSFLLALCDLRGEIRKITARSNIQRDTKVFVIATVNNVPLFDSLQANALSSRFANKINFRRPSRDMLIKILTREISKVDGNLDWIEPALNYCETRPEPIVDPRIVTALCLCGREKWLDGSFAKMMADTEPETGPFEDLASPIG